jgi:alpha-ketoglutaric semialdehyde dehydrogenase
VDRLTGKHHIKGQPTAGGSGKTFTVTNPATGETLTTAFAEGGAAEVDVCLKAADAAFDQLQTVPWETIAALLDDIAARIDAIGAPLLERAHAETALPMGRLESERGRTTNNIRLFAKMVREGSWLQARVDHADPVRQPLPKPDVRAMMMGIGPVAMFGASNFPLAISVAGTDTIAAFAARCPVIVKSHPGHPGTSELIAKAIVEAVAAAGLPAGMFAFLQGTSNDLGRALVEHPLTAAVAFTGSLRGGRALFDAANARPQPIPVYAEMGSVNPVFLLPGAVGERGAKIAESYIQSVALGVGQFCTNPGMVLGVADAGLKTFLETTAAAAANVAPATMLHGGIYNAFEKGVDRLASCPGVESIAASATAADGSKHQAAVRIFAADASLADREELREEVFGPASVVIRCKNVEEMYEIARNLDCHLTATIHGTEAELLEHAALVRILQRKVGRLIFNGFPTGLEICPSMHHGGPYPATTHSHFTSIGQAAIYRFTRPICYQGFPESALPPELKDANPRNLHRVVDGQFA